MSAIIWFQYKIKKSSSTYLLLNSLNEPVSASISLTSCKWLFSPTAFHTNYVSCLGGLCEAHVMAGAGARSQAVAVGPAAGVPVPVSMDHVHCGPGRNL